MIVEEELAEVVPMVPERPTESDQDKFEGGITVGQEGPHGAKEPTTATIPPLRYDVLCRSRLHENATCPEK